MKLKLFIFKIMIFACLCTFSISTFAEDEVVTVNSYDDFKKAILNSILTENKKFQVEISNYNDREYSFSKALDELQLTNPEVAFLFAKADSGNISGYSDSTSRTMKFNFSYKNSYKSLSNIIEIKSPDDLYKAILNDFDNYKENAIFKIVGYSKDKYVIPEIINDMFTKRIDLKAFYERLNTSFYGKGNDIIVELKYNYTYPIEKVKELRKKTDEKAKEIVSKIVNDSMPDYQKELIIHDYIVNNTLYDKEAVSSKDPDPAVYTAYGLFFNKKAVCEGYASAFQIMLNNAGIESFFVPGKSKNEEHAWNIVKIQGEYYLVDTTWDDPVTSSGEQTLVHTYFNLTNEEMRKDHTWDESKFPICTSKKYSYEIVAEKVETINKQSYLSSNESDEKTNIVNMNNNLEKQKQIEKLLQINTNEEEKQINLNAQIIQTDSKPKNESTIKTEIKENTQSVKNSSNIKDNSNIIDASSNEIDKNLSKDKNLSQVNDKKEIKLSLGKPTFTVNGEKRELESGKNVSPVVMNGRTTVPLRAITEILGGDVKWDDNTKSITIIREDRTVVLKLKDTKALVNGKEVLLEIAPTIINGRTFVPLRFIAEAFGCNVDWDSKTKEIIIKS